MVIGNFSRVSCGVCNASSETCFVQRVVWIMAYVIVMQWVILFLYLYQRHSFDTNISTCFGALTNDKARISTIRIPFHLCWNMCRTTSCLNILPILVSSGVCNASAHHWEICTTCFCIVYLVWQQYFPLLCYDKICTFPERCKSTHLENKVQDTVQPKLYVLQHL